MQLKQRLFIGFLSLGLIYFTACAATEPILSDNEYIARAETMMQEEEYEKARETYLKVREIYPDSSLIAETRLGIADSYFEANEYVEAIAKYEEFIKFHPLNKLAPQAQYRLAMCYFNQMLGYDRDQADTSKALAEFNKVILYYPASPEADDALKRRLVCLDQLAQHEFYVGKFYFIREEYTAAISRFKYGLLNYPTTGVIEEATYYLAESYWQMGKQKEGREVFRLLLSRFPGGNFSDHAQERLALNE
jgi:outer membrane protein assembly factor BamD